MCNALKVRWTIVPKTAPEPWLSCRRLDAWLIYKCVACDATWNRPIVERQPVRSLAPADLAAMQANDADWVRAHEFDLDALRRHSRRIGESVAADIRKEIVDGPPDWRRLEILLAVPWPVGLRLDRLLAAELPLSRGALAAMHERALLRLMPDDPKSLRRPVKDGTRLTIDLDGEPDRERTWRLAAGRA